LLKDLIELADDVDLAILSAERGDNLALEARLEEIRDHSIALVAKLAKENANEPD
jgi:hypothetical protein